MARKPTFQIEYNNVKENEEKTLDKSKDKFKNIEKQEVNHFNNLSSKTWSNSPIFVFKQNAKYNIVVDKVERNI